MVALSLLSCSRESAARYGDERYSNMILNTETDALQAKTVLTELREGRRTNALELLEMQIDTSVLMVNQSLTNLSGSDRDAAMSTLRLLTAYREAYPRKQEANLPADKTDAEALIPGRRDASRILNNLK